MLDHKTRQTGRQRKLCETKHTHTTHYTAQKKTEWICSRDFNTAVQIDVIDCTTQHKSR